MDGSRVIQSLDFLWFFTNIFSPRNDESVGSADNEITPLNHAKELSNEEFCIPITPICLNQQNELASAENLITWCPKCGDFASEIDEKKVTPVDKEMLEFGRETEMEERKKKRRRRKKSGFNGKRKILGELELGFDVKEIYGSWMFEEACEYQRVASIHQTGMPPLSDDLAMKEHLKSWAYAVACTVK
ncbi:WD repeat-containing protein 53 [Quillaja saponaria]|uniref:WD repeat-containing protein 53 n=1 Tax=Quillaja saponaria TaxID=32244 RepID=A0AAD7KWJ1_QUISA|nr:WD repeat-containing protein 53 [Quillaja saponaria]